MYEEELKIPRERVAVLIGTKGATKRRIQQATNTKITISKEGDVIIEAEEAVNAYLAVPIVKAIGRGVNPDVATELLKEDRCLELINMQDFTGRSVKKLTRLKARLIGTQGKARKVIERLTNTSITVYGKTVTIIGKSDEVFIAKQAVEKMLSGAPHGNVYKFIATQTKKLAEE